MQTKRSDDHGRTALSTISIPSHLPVEYFFCVLYRSLFLFFIHVILETKEKERRTKLTTTSLFSTGRKNSKGLFFLNLSTVVSFFFISLFICSRRSVDLVIYMQGIAYRKTCVNIFFLTRGIIVSNNRQRNITSLNLLTFNHCLFTHTVYYTFFFLIILFRRPLLSFTYSRTRLCFFFFEFALIFFFLEKKGKESWSLSSSQHFVNFNSPRAQCLNFYLIFLLI